MMFPHILSLHMSTEEGPRPKIYWIAFIWSLVSTVEHEVILHHNNFNTWLKKRAEAALERSQMKI